MALLAQLRRFFGRREASDSDPNHARRGEAATRNPAAERILAQIVEETIDAGDTFSGHLSASARFLALKQESEDTQIAVLIAAIETLKSTGSCQNGTVYQVSCVKRTFVSQMLRRRITFPVDLLHKLLLAWVEAVRPLEHSDVPGLPLLGALERHGAQYGIPDMLVPALKALHKRAGEPGPWQPQPDKFERGVANRAMRLLQTDAPTTVPVLTRGIFQNWWQAQIAGLPDTQQRRWAALAEHAGTAADKSKPTRDWLCQAEQLLASEMKHTFSASLSDWLLATTPDPRQPDPSLDIFKGFIWMAPLAPTDALICNLGRFAQTCFEKIPDVGARSVKLGNAVFYALSQMDDVAQAGAQLFRLSTVITYPSARKVMRARMAEMAENNSADITALEDAAMPDHAIGKDGTLKRMVGEVAAIIALSAAGTQIRWRTETGKLLKTPPASLRTAHKQAVADVRQLARTIEQSRRTVALRLEAGWLEKRQWSYADWLTHYCAHNLRRGVAGSLIWQIAEGADKRSVILHKDALQDIAGNTIAPSPSATVSLWHPLHADPQEVLAWRARIIALGLTQPFKQAHREIYVLTEAERETGSYSNRFAAHILRQHQFRALCHLRTWRFDLLGGWDNQNMPTRAVPAHNMLAEFCLTPAAGSAQSTANVPLYLTTDRVHFLDAQSRTSIPLAQVDPIIFSEVLRDIDLFVAVTSVTANPQWQDGGPEGPFRTYWHDFAQKALGESAQMRRKLIEQIMPHLSIRDKLKVGEKALIVKGERHTYAIHFGSAAVQIMPQRRYLCIVAARSYADADRIHLPFAGDSQFSAILSKAFMLADDTNITDDAILRQLE